MALQGSGSQGAPISGLLPGLPEDDAVGTEERARKCLPLIRTIGCCLGVC